MLLAGSRAAHKLACARHAATTSSVVAARQQLINSQPAFLTRAVSDEAAAVEGSEEGPRTPQVFARFNVYKGKGAMTVKPLKPVWQTTAKGGWEIKREGSMMFEIANAAGTRTYDWEKKIQVALSPLELAAIVSQPNMQHSFYHDTFKGGPQEGTKVKSFRWDPSDNGYFINVKLTDKTGGSEKVSSASVSLSIPEFYVLQQLINNTMHYHYGFDAFYVADQVQ